MSWAVPKGPSLDPSKKRLAIHVEDHPLDYLDFEGVIPEGQYGAGAVIVWDRGVWLPDDDAVAGLERGKLAFALHGYKLSGRWVLVRLRNRGRRSEEWLLKKASDEAATDKHAPDEHSIYSGLLVEERDRDSEAAPRRRARRARVAARPETHGQCAAPAPDPVHDD